MSIEKLNTIAEADIEKINGIANSSIQKVSGIDMDAPVYPVSQYKINSSGLRLIHGASNDGNIFVNSGVEVAQGGSATLASYSLTCESGVAVSVIGGEGWNLFQRTAAGGIPDSGDRNSFTLASTVAGTTVKTKTSTTYSSAESDADHTIINTTAASVTVAETVTVDSSGHADTVFQICNYHLAAASFKEDTNGPTVIASNWQIDPDSGGTITPLDSSGNSNYTDVAGDGNAVSIISEGVGNYNKYRIRRPKDNQRILVKGYFIFTRTDGSGGTRTASLNVGGIGAVVASSSASPYKVQLERTFLEDASGATGDAAIIVDDIVAQVTCSDGDGAFKVSFATMSWQVTSGTESA